MGRTRLIVIDKLDEADHPHARGENSRHRAFGRASTGPSPRAWGEHFNPRFHFSVVRTIPTRVGRTPRISSCPCFLPDHPHARGENFVTVGADAHQPGPSPRAWGELKCWLGVDPVCRTIPTRVGRTSAGAVFARLRPDHPHARGENSVDDMRLLKNAGPSPRAWGEHRATSRGHPRVRTIPTRVGRTNSPVAGTVNAPDHPHARGENCVFRYHDCCCSGPSPRAWGELQKPGPAVILARTIPTRVGRTTRASLTNSGPTDHPHARGENVGPFANLFPQHGPSPRAWGERSDTDEDNRTLRTIPTRVGRTPGGVSRERAKTDHPHARGENSAACPSNEVVTGPSPRAWGELGVKCVALAASRTIPTRVGRTSAPYPDRKKISDHPHARGENASDSRVHDLKRGPSPRAWGERKQGRPRMPARRTIPTRVGRTLPICLALSASPDHPHARGEN